MKKKLITLCAVTALTVVSLAGCGSDNASTTSSTNTTTTQSTTQTAAPKAETTQEAATNDQEDSNAASEGETDTSWADNYNKFYAGITDDENTYMYLAFGQDGTIGVAMFFDKESKESGSWVGDCTDNGDDTITISDEKNGTSLTMGVKQEEDGYMLDMGEVGQAAVGEVSKEDFVAAATAIDQGTEPQF